MLPEQTSRDTHSQIFCGEVTAEGDRSIEAKQIITKALSPLLILDTGRECTPAISMQLLGMVSQHCCTRAGTQSRAGARAAAGKHSACTCPLASSGEAARGHRAFGHGEKAQPWLALPRRASLLRQAYSQLFGIARAAQPCISSNTGCNSLSSLNKSVSHKQQKCTPRREKPC